MKRMTFLVVLLLAALMVTGCNKSVPQGRVGRVKTAGGWGGEVLSSGHHQCWGRDTMYTADVTERRYNEIMAILVGGKVNLKVTVSVRCSLRQSNEDQLASVFENIRANEEEFITHEEMYNTYVKLVVESAPRVIIGGQTDVQAVTANRSEIIAQVQKMIMEKTESTPMQVKAVEITNWDWPESITDAQERLVGIQLTEQEEEARTRANLKKAEGQLKIAIKDQLVELKEAETVAKSNKLIGESLRNNPEYLQWHTVRAMSEAARGPNNAFILFPYNMPSKPLIQNAQLQQMFHTQRPQILPVKKK